MQQNNDYKMAQIANQGNLISNEEEYKVRPQSSHDFGLNQSAQHFIPDQNFVAIPRPVMNIYAASFQPSF